MGTLVNSWWWSHELQLLVSRPPTAHPFWALWGYWMVRVTEMCPLFSCCFTQTVEDSGTPKGRRRWDTQLAPNDWALLFEMFVMHLQIFRGHPHITGTVGMRGKDDLKKNMYESLVISFRVAFQFRCDRSEVVFCLLALSTIKRVRLKQPTFPTQFPRLNLPTSFKIWSFGWWRELLGVF